MDSNLFFRLASRRFFSSRPVVIISSREEASSRRHLTRPNRLRLEHDPPEIELRAVQRVMIHRVGSFGIRGGPRLRSRGTGHMDFQFFRKSWTCLGWAKKGDGSRLDDEEKKRPAGRRLSQPDRTAERTAIQAAVSYLFIHNTSYPRNSKSARVSSGIFMAASLAGQSG